MLVEVSRECGKAVLPHYMGQKIVLASELTAEPDVPIVCEVGGCVLANCWTSSCAFKCGVNKACQEGGQE